MKRVEEQNIVIGKKLKEYRGRIERGENSCTISNLITLCNLFGISSEDLIGSLTTTKPDDGISNDFQKLTLEDKLSVANYVDFLLSRYK